MTPATHIAVRHAQAADAPAIRALLTSAGLSVDAVDADVDHLVALDGKAIIGVAALERYGPVGLLRSVAVAAEWRRQRVASTLVEAVGQTCGDVSALYLFTETAEAFFASCGFSKVQRAALPPTIAQSTQALHMCPVSAIAMCREHLKTKKRA